MCFKEIMLVVLILLSVVTVEADDDANFRLTILIEMDWSEGDMYRNYFGTADLYVHLSELQNAPITPMSLRFQYGNDEVSFSEPWDEGMSHHTYSLAIMYDPFTDPSYEGPLPGTN